MDKPPQPQTFDEVTGDAFMAALERLEKEVEQELDFELSTFDRGHTYVVNLAVAPMVIDGGYFRHHTRAQLVKEGLRLSTKVSGVRFVKAPEPTIWTRVWSAR